VIAAHAIAAEVVAFADSGLLETLIETYSTLKTCLDQAHGWRSTTPALSHPSKLNS